MSELNLFICPFCEHKQESKNVRSCTCGECGRSMVRVPNRQKTKIPSDNSGGGLSDDNTYKNTKTTSESDNSVNPSKLSDTNSKKNNEVEEMKKEEKEKEKELESLRSEARDEEIAELKKKKAEKSSKTKTITKDDLGLEDEETPTEQTETLCSECGTKVDGKPEKCPNCQEEFEY